jgi:hypothetical protein
LLNGFIKVRQGGFTMLISNRPGLGGFAFRGRARSTLIALLFFVGTVGPAAGKPLALDEVPEPLQAWTEWVLRGHEPQRCPFFSIQPGRGNSTKHCSWPSHLELDLGDRSGRFTQQWQVFAAVRVPLPGGEDRWPLDVKVGDQPAPVVIVGKRPMLELEAGTHSVSGSFSWDALPEMLTIPPETGLISLRLRGQHVELPDRDAPGRLWLERRIAPDAGEASWVEVVVHRRLNDEIPLRLETQIELRVGGRSREALLGTALPSGFIPMALISPLPARLDADGRLRVQLRPGTWKLTLNARHDGRTDAISPPAQVDDVRADGEAQWDAEEVWVFDAQPRLRIVEVTGAAPVDPNQTTLPAQWRQLPAYLMESGSALHFEEKRRGDDDPAPDDLKLKRTWWLDFDGGGFTVTDQITGVVRRSTRLEMNDSIVLGRVALDGKDQFITRVEGGAGAGVEIPLGKIQIASDSRVGERSGLSAVGWNHDFQSLSADLWLPPGWRLFHATGVDRATSTWLNHWTLLDLFVVLVTAMAVYRLWGVGAGLLAIAALALGFTESGAPNWLWLAVLIGEGLRRGLPEGRFSKLVSFYRAAAIGCLVLVAIPFGVEQLRIARNPVLEGSRGYLMSGPGRGYVSRMADSFEESKIAVTQFSAADVSTLGYVEADAPQAAPSPTKVRKQRQSFKMDRYRPDPQARITTGPGLPAWTWNQVSLYWSGPVSRDQGLAFVLIPPWLVSLLGFLRVALMAALVLCVMGVKPGSGGSGFLGLSVLRTGAGAGAAAAITGMLLMAAPQPARADFPSSQLLGELRAALLENPECYPACASIPRLRVDVDSNVLTLRLEVDTAANTAIPLPGSLRSWQPAAVSVDGAPARGLLRDSAGVLWLQLTPGRHQVLCRGPLPDRDSVDLALPLRPLRVEAKTGDWQLHGLREDGLAESALQLTRKKREVSAKLEPGELPPFLKVTRELMLDLDWRLHTVVTRVTPGGTAVLIEVPLLPGESVTSDRIRVRDGKVMVSLAPGEYEVAWSSQLKIVSELALTAAENSEWTERWRLNVSPIWHVEAEGIPPIHADSPSGQRVREWRPWPGETVELHVMRPAGVEGETLTIDSSLLTITPGLRSTDTTLSVNLRSSRGGIHDIVLPEAASLKSVKVDGKLQPIRLEGRSLAVPIHPGGQTVEISWRDPRGFTDGLLYRTPAVDLGVPSVNAQISLQPSLGRWILALGGSGMGPSVLFWSILFALAVLSFGLSRLSITPLRFHEWLLLGVGLTQVPISAAALVVGWLLALGLRGDRGTAVPGRWFNLIQIMLVGLGGAAMVVLLFSIHRGLLGSPEMQIAGNGSTANYLRWYLDRAMETPAQAWLFSVPVLVYRLAMLAWALWLAQALLRWLRWGWECFTAGELWRPLRKNKLPEAKD